MGNKVAQKGIFAGFNVCHKQIFSAGAEVNRFFFEYLKMIVPARRYL